MGRRARFQALSIGRQLALLNLVLLIGYAIVFLILRGEIWTELGGDLLMFLFFDSFFVYELRQIRKRRKTHA